MEPDCATLPATQDHPKNPESVSSEAESIPPFSSVPLPDPEMQYLPDLVEQVIGDNSVSAGGPAPGGRFPVRLYKSIVSRLTRCAVFPVAQRVTDTNRALKQAVLSLSCEVEGQKNTIRELNARVRALEDALARLQPGDSGSISSGGQKPL